MKLMYCQNCHDIVVPSPTAFKVNWCTCQQHAVWWRDPHTGLLSLHDKHHVPKETLSIYRYYPKNPRAYVLGISNIIFRDDRPMSKEVVQQMISYHDDSYLFKKWETLIIRIRPGESGDTNWAALP